MNQLGGLYGNQKHPSSATGRPLRYGQKFEACPYLLGIGLLTGLCVVTRKIHMIVVFTAELEAWLGARQHIQDAMPSSTIEEREFLLSGTSPEGWALTFPPEEEE
ncbi:MAG: hypothetical protein V3R16_09595 [Nitrospirales bacterium]